MSEYIIDAREYLPKFLLDSPIILSIIDCLNVLISNETPFFNEINEAYLDSTYKTRNYFKLSSGAKIAIIKELGFDYLLDIVPMTDDQLSRLLIFFNLVYALKGKEEGLLICLQALGIPKENITYTTWDETSPKKPNFTATLSIVGDNYAKDQVFKKLKNFVRCYMLPWIDIVIITTVEGATFYLYPSWGFVQHTKNTTEWNTTRDLEEEFSVILPSGPNQSKVKKSKYINVNFKLKKNMKLVVNDKELTYQIPNYTTTEISIDKLATNRENYIGCNYDSGKVYISEDAKTWEEILEVEEPSLLKCINNRYFLNDKDTTYYSDDGLDWIALDVKLNDITYGDKYVGAADKGMGYYSEDGIEWEEMYIEPDYQPTIIPTEMALLGWESELGNLYTQTTPLLGEEVALYNEDGEVFLIDGEEAKLTYKAFEVPIEPEPTPEETEPTPEEGSGEPTESEEGGESSEPTESEESSESEEGISLQNEEIEEGIETETPSEGSTENPTEGSGEETETPTEPTEETPTEPQTQTVYLFAIVGNDIIVTKNDELDKILESEVIIPAQEREEYKYDKIAYNGSYYIALAYVEKSSYAISYDGINWNLLGIPPFLQSTGRSNFFNSDLIPINNSFIISIDGQGIYRSQNLWNWLYIGQPVHQLIWVNDKLKGFSGNILYTIDSNFNISSIEIDLPKKYVPQPEVTPDPEPSEGTDDSQPSEGTEGSGEPTEENIEGTPEPNEEEIATQADELEEPTEVPEESNEENSQSSESSEENPEPSESENEEEVTPEEPQEEVYEEVYAMLYNGDYIIAQQTQCYIVSPVSGEPIFKNSDDREEIYSIIITINRGDLVDYKVTQGNKKYESHIAPLNNEELNLSEIFN